MMDCIDPKNPTGPECSGKGQCVCGRCECETRNNDNEVGDILEVLFLLQI